jgi:hypothetical protein
MNNRFIFNLIDIDNHIINFLDPITDLKNGKNIAVTIQRVTNQEVLISYKINKKL